MDLIIKVWKYTKKCLTRIGFKSETTEMTSPASEPTELSSP